MFIKYIVYVFIPCVIAGFIGSQFAIKCGVYPENSNLTIIPDICHYLYEENALTNQ